MGMDAALRETGGARGIGHYCHVVGTCGMRAGLVAGGQRVAPGHGAGRQRVLGGQPGGRRVLGVFVALGQRVGVLGHQQMLQLLLLRQLGIGGRGAAGQIGRADRHARLRVGDVVLEFLGAVHRIDGHHHRIGAQDRVVADDELRAVLHVQQDPVALGHAGLALQPAGQRGRLRLELAEGNGLAEVADRGLVGIAARRHFQIDPQRGLGQHDGGGRPLGPELEMRARGGLLGLHALSPERSSRPVLEHRCWAS